MTAAKAGLAVYLLKIHTLSPCMCVEEVSGTENHFHLDHCFSLSVKGTYITPIRGFILTLPSSSLSYCSSIWFPPAGPTGNINLPPGFNWSISQNTTQKLECNQPLQRSWIQSLLQQINSFAIMYLSTFMQQITTSIRKNKKCTENESITATWYNNCYYSKIINWVGCSFIFCIRGGNM